MSISRLTLLQHASNARRLINNPDVPQPIKDQARKALNHAEVALGLDAAMKRKVALERALDPAELQALKAKKASFANR